MSSILLWYLFLPLPHFPSPRLFFLFSIFCLLFPRLAFSYAFLKQTLTLKQCSIYLCFVYFLEAYKTFYTLHYLYLFSLLFPYASLSLLRWLSIRNWIILCETLYFFWCVCLPLVESAMKTGEFSSFFLRTHIRIIVVLILFFSPFYFLFFSCLFFFPMAELIRVFFVCFFLSVSIFLSSVWFGELFILLFLLLRSFLYFSLQFFFLFFIYLSLYSFIYRSHLEKRIM